MMIMMRGMAERVCPCVCVCYRHPASQGIIFYTVKSVNNTKNIILFSFLVGWLKHSPFLA